MINVNLKSVISVKPEQRCKLAYRTLGGSISIFLSYTAIKYFPVSYTVTMRNVAHFFALIFSTTCGNESPTLGNTVLLLVVTGMVLCFVLPNYNINSEGEVNKS